MYQNHRNAPPSLRASSTSSCSMLQESAALMLSCSRSSRSNHAASSGPHNLGSACSARARKYSAWARFMAPASVVSSNFSSANSRMVSSITRRGSAPGSSSWRNRLLSNSEETPSSVSMGRSPRGSHTASMPSRVLPPEKTQPRKEHLLSLVEHLVAPRDRVPQGPLPLWQVSGPAGQQLEAVAQTREHRLRGKQLYPRRRELYGQGQSVEPRTDLDHRGVVLLRQREVWPDGLGPLHEEPERLVLCGALNGWRGRGVG